MWQADFAPSGAASCPRASASDEVWAAAIVRALARHPVDIVELLSPAALAEAGGIQRFATMARAVRAHDATTVVAGGGFAFSDPRAAATDLALGAFLTAVRDDDVPLDVLTFAAHAPTPGLVAEIARALRTPRRAGPHGRRPRAHRVRARRADHHLRPEPRLGPGRRPSRWPAASSSRTSRA
ncbi:MAG: hypothetical protein U1F43_23905 [Myxococcota bacterium]